MIARFRSTLLFLACLLTACAVNPLTPTPVATATLPPVVVRVATGTFTPPPTLTLTPRATWTASAERRLELTEAPPAAGGALDVPTLEPTAVVFVEQQVQVTLPPAPPVATAIPPVLVAPPPSGDVAAAEQYCIDLINVQRANAGLPPYARNETVMGIARARVADMVARGYRGHNDPVTGAALGRDMLLGAGFGLAGENWYGHRSGPVAIVEAAMAWFMTDPLHAQGILSSGFTLVGVGIAFNGQQWLLIQNFAG